jgi:peroxiredoxin
MKKALLILLTALASSSLLKAQEGFPLPVFIGTTLNGTGIDSSWFKGKVTLISFFYIGCAPCMKEIPVLNRLQERLSGRGFQILGIAPHTAKQLRLFYPGDSLLNNISLAQLRTQAIQYEMLPECPPDNLTGTAPRCYTISSQFGVQAWPTAFIVNRQGRIIMTKEGFPMRDNIDETLEELVKEMEGYLR